MWQDWIISGISWVFIVALFPTILHKTEKPTLSTSIVTGVSIFILAVTYATLEFWIAVISSVALGTAWLTIAFQRYRINKKAKL